MSSRIMLAASIRILAFAMVLAGTGCMTFAEKKLKLEVGMRKYEVIKLLGSPESTTGQGSIEYMVYPQDSDVPDEHFYVRLVNDVVESYGSSSYYPRIRVKSMLTGDDPSKAAAELLAK